MVMIRVVSFDFYGTLARFDPPGEVIQASILQEFGLVVEQEALRQGYVAADTFMARENGRNWVFRRTLAKRDAFFAEYERVLLQAAGVEVGADLAIQVWRRVAQVPRGLALFDDVVPALSALKERGLVLGVISNMERDVEELPPQLSIRQWLDFWVMSCEVGHNKPHPAIFQEALRKTRVQPEEALHVGDQYHSDVVGARMAGLHAILLDRLGVLDKLAECRRVRNLTEVADYLWNEEREHPPTGVGGGI